MLGKGQVNDREILISGAGVAGHALAYWLGRYGFTPTVVEQAPAPREGGYAVDVRGAAVEAAERMGVLPEIRAARTGSRGMSYELARRGDLPARRVGRRWLFLRDRLAAAITPLDDPAAWKPRNGT